MEEIQQLINKAIDLIERSEPDETDKLSYILKMREMVHYMDSYAHKIDEDDKLGSANGLILDIYHKTK